MAKNNYLISNKIILVGWMDKVFDQTLNKRTFIWGFKAIGIWPFNLKAIDAKTQLSEIYITKPYKAWDQEPNNSNDVNFKIQQKEMMILLQHKFWI
jgi:hypothetical protein